MPSTPSPYEGREISLFEHLNLSSYWFATNFLWGALLAIMIPAEIRAMLPQYRVQAVSILLFVSALVALTVPLIAGALSDRCASPYGRRRPYIAVGVVLNVIGLAFMAVSYALSEPIPTDSAAATRGYLGVAGLMLTNGPLLGYCLAFMLVQFGNNIASAAYSGIIPDLVPLDQRGKASGFMAAMSQIGTLGGVFAVSQLGDKQSLLQYVCLSVLLVAITLYTLFGIKENPLSSKPPKIEWRSYLKSLWISPKQHPDFAWVWITRALVMLGFYSILPFLNYYLIDVIGLANPTEPAAKIIGVILIASALSGMAGGFVSDRIGRKRVVYLANMVIAVMAIAFIFCRNLNQVLLAGVCFGLGYGAYVSVDWALGTDVLPSKNDAAKEMAVWHIAMTLPMSLASVIGGLFIGAFGQKHETVNGELIYHYPIAGYSLVFIFCAICFALGAFLLRNVRGVR